MITTKYFDAIREAQATQRPLSELPQFDLNRLRSKSGVGARISGFFEDPRWLLSLLRRFWPNVRVGRFLLVTRNKEVRDILERGDEFQTPYGPEMAELAGGCNFILGMQDGSDYRRMKSVVLSAFPPAEVEAVVRPIAARHCRAIVVRAVPGFDAVGGLLKLVPVRICRDYFGVVVDDEAEFADWAIALSALFFSDPLANKATRELAMIAADRMIRTVDRSILAVREGRTGADTPLARLVAQLDQGRISTKEIHSIMLGMIAGFAPTNVLAGANCLDVVLSKPEAQRAVEQAVAEGDTEKLDRAILEAMRFRPIWIGPWRYAARDAVIARGTARERVVKAGTTVMPATLSAMFDPDAVQKPNEFDPTRPHRDYLVYGHGIHLCIGAEVARVQIGESLRALFQKKGVRRAAGRAGRLTRIGAYPESLRVDFERAPLCRTVAHAMITAICPVKPTASLAELSIKIAAFGNPAREDIRQALDAAGIIHFCSLAAAGAGRSGRSSGRNESVLVLELSGDGSADEVIEAFAGHAGPLVRSIFEEACDLPAGAALQHFLRQHAVDISPSFGSNTGLVFSGTPGHSVVRIRAEADLAETARSIVEKPADGGPHSAAGLLAEVRQHLESVGNCDWAFEPAESQLERREGSVWRAALTTLRAPTMLGVTTALVIAWWWITYRFVFGYAPGFFRNLMVGGTSLLLAVLGLTVLVLIALGLCLLALRRLEGRDSPDKAAVEIDRLEEIQAREDLTAQNHLTTISEMKRGILRRLAMRLTFYLISISAQKVFRPGYLANISTIHFARWVLLPGSNRLMFLSNYGGSWESYLEDFVTKAASGLTGVWSNTEGFPRTRWLFLDGARDAGRFKRWARRQQVPTLFWYSAYPKLNTARIRINSRIRRGIAVATESEARNWLSLFGSSPRPVAARQPEPSDLPAQASIPAEYLDTGEIQAIFFSAFGSLESAAMLAIRVPDNVPRQKRKAWLEFIASRVSFGDSTPRSRAMTIGLGPAAIKSLGLDGDVGDKTLSSFPVAFRQGMGNTARSRILDDVGESGPQHWQWGSTQNPVDMIIVCYAADPQALKAELGEVERRTKAAGLVVATQLPLTIRRQGKRAVEHFGFVDGVSQPIVRGTARGSAGVAPMHLVAAGEFLFGYRDEHGFYPDSPVVPASHDASGILPALRARRPADGRDLPMHDFGRNGSFLVARQFEQHTGRFKDYCETAAKEKSKELGDATITPQWIAAKMLGRWQDGTSLVRNPEGRSGRAPDNDYSFGMEDPQGHRCPFGSHVRRSNPRDSLGSDHATQIRIGKRHRILRVGRPYEKAAKGQAKAEKGLLFMCLNADIERQYEFIQQTWVTGSSFHGLSGEKDPTIGSSDGEGRFTIPSWEGVTVLKGIPQFVTTRGGGYFFLPSRSALRYLISRL
jgi:Dyp-type peroxidase family